MTTRTLEEDFNLICKSAGLTKLLVSPKPTWLTADRTEGVELDGTTIRMFNNEKGERAYKDAPGSKLQVIIDAFKVPPAPEVKHGHDEKEHQETEKGKDAKTEERKTNAPEAKGDVNKMEPKKDPLFCIECKSSEFVILHHEGEFTIYKCKCGLAWRERKPLPVLEETRDYKGDVGWEKPPKKPDAVLPVKTYTPQGCMIKGFIPQLKEIGKIKIGKKGAMKESAGGKQFRQPVKFDHFEITGILKDDKTDDYLLDPIMQTLGEKPIELDILLLYNDISLNFRTRYNAYSGGKCICTGDGENATTLERELRVCNPEACEIFQKKKCKVNGILSCILMKSPRLGGVYKFRTTSFHTVRSILSSLMFLSTITGGVLSMLPLKLVLSPMKVQPKDMQTTQTIYVVNVEFAGTAQDLLQTMFEVQKYQGAMRAQILELEQTARLALSEPESEQEAKDVQDEFYPEEKQEAR